MRLIVIGAVLVLLCSCSKDVESLRAELATLEKEQRSEPIPLPTMRPLPEFRYEAGGVPDPFYPERR